MNPTFPPHPEYNVSNVGEGILEIRYQAFWCQPHLGSADAPAYSGILPGRDRVLLRIPLSTTLCRLVVLILLSAIFGIVPLMELIWEVVRVVGSGLLYAFLVLYYLIADFN